MKFLGIGSSTHVALYRPTSDMNSIMPLKPGNKHVGGGGGVFCLMLTDCPEHKGAEALGVPRKLADVVDFPQLATQKHSSDQGCQHG